MFISIAIMNYEARNGIIGKTFPLRFKTNVGPVHMEAREALIKTKPGRFSNDKEHLIQRSNFFGHIKGIPHNAIQAG
jgi:hypothetical protein